MEHKVIPIVDNSCNTKWYPQWIIVGMVKYLGNWNAYPCTIMVYY